MIPSITIYIRHAADCPHTDDETWKRCNCRKHLRWTWEGRQLRRSAKTRSWSGAEQEKRKLEIQYETALAGETAKSDDPVSIEQAITAFTADKTGARASGNTLSKYKLTLSRLQDFCTARVRQFQPAATQAPKVPASTEAHRSAESSPPTYRVASCLTTRLRNQVCNL